MHRKPGTTPPLLVLVAALAALALAAGCARGQVAGAEAASHQAAVAVAPVSGTGLSRVVLSRQAAGRLGVQTATVREARVASPAAGGPTTRTTRTVIPYAAVLYDEHGDTWTFTVPAPLTYLRAAIDVDYVEGDLAILRSGPPAGTTIVTVGAEELLGAELGVGGE